MAHVRDRAAAGAVRRVYNAVADAEAGVGAFAHVDPDRHAYRAAVRALIRRSRTDLAFALYKVRMDARRRRPDTLPPDVSLAAGVLRAVIRDGKKRHQVALDAALLYDDIKLHSARLADDPDAPSTAENASAIAAVVTTLLDRDKVQDATVRDALDMTRHLVTLSHKAGPSAAIPVREYNKCIRLFGKNRCVHGVFTVLDCMHACGVERDNETFEFLANSVVRQVEFVTGAVSMDTLPAPLEAEVAFVGRSNVGKSSLVNMICNRKALAYVSGRPGKTQQFNYFLVNKGDPKSAFHLVDLPGVGFARVSKPLQASWLTFMDEYLAQRSSLRVVFHLVDGRHGAMGDDQLLMQRVAQSGRSDRYVVVLTKMDKVDKQKAKRSTLDRTKHMLIQNGCAPDTPILLTSASSRLGRDEVWRYLQRALKI